ncbi:cation:proton antiporter [Devosia chinhatensis]|uniref:Cation:proton antiporter n=1 Tax=Devosia chinhatensis TaxID=429727 RepID=A0A0F5FN00_9HYPH|nr:cation:proton antiporter [Devosia chinhatensis]
MSDLTILAGGVLLIVGSFFVLAAAIGVIRLPDLYTRMHAASKAGAVGGGLILIAVALVEQDVAIAMRAILGFIFLLLTTPLAAHLLARSSYFAGYKPCTRTVVDDMSGSPEQNSANK